MATRVIAVPVFFASLCIGVVPVQTQMALGLRAPARNPPHRPPPWSGQRRLLSTSQRVNNP